MQSRFASRDNVLQPQTHRPDRNRILHCSNDIQLHVRKVSNAVEVDYYGCSLASVGVHVLNLTLRQVDRDSKTGDFCLFLWTEMLIQDDYSLQIFRNSGPYILKKMQRAFPGWRWIESPRLDGYD